LDSNRLVHVGFLRGTVHHGALFPGPNCGVGVASQVW
jgi:hypothetical protein